MTTVSKASSINVGIDVGKAQLDIFIHERDTYFSVANNTQGIRKAIGRIGRYKVARIVLEATGRYEHAFVEAALDKDMPVIVSNPINIRRYAGAIGQIAKTDEIDCQLIARYAAVIQPPVRKH